MNRLQLLIEHYRQLDDRTRLLWGCAIAGFLVLILLYSAANKQVASLIAKRSAREAEIAEMLLLEVRYQQANAGAQKLSNRLAAVRADDTPSKLIEEIGIKGKSSQIRPLKGEEKPGYVEDMAEVKLEGVTANEAINLFHRLEKGSKPVLIKKALLKTRFDDPARLDLTLAIALLKSSPQGQR